jgi:hypothetical protein
MSTTEKIHDEQDSIIDPRVSDRGNCHPRRNGFKSADINADSRRQRFSGARRIAGANSGAVAQSGFG